MLRIHGILLIYRKFLVDRLKAHTLCLMEHRSAIGVKELECRLDFRLPKSHFIAMTFEFATP